MNKLYRVKIKGIDKTYLAHGDGPDETVKNLSQITKVAEEDIEITQYEKVDYLYGTTLYTTK